MKMMLGVVMGDCHGIWGGMLRIRSWMEGSANGISDFIDEVLKVIMCHEGFS
jgi:hypothetical protein